MRWCDKSDSFGLANCVRLLRAWGNWIWAIVIVTVTCAVYSPCFHGDFIWDDALWTTMIEPLLRNSAGLWRMWVTPTSLHHYFPVTGTSFWIDHQLWGDWTLPYHLENVILHAISALLFWRLLAALGVPNAWLAGALFALHPVMVESVAWITERKNVVSLSLSLGALLAYGKFESFWNSRSGGKPIRSWVAYATSWMLLAMALLAKITAFAMLPAVLLICWWKRGAIGFRRDLVPLLPFFVLTLALGIGAMWMERHQVGAVGQDWNLTAAERVLVAGRALFFYATQLLWPQSLCPVYPQWRLDSHSWVQWLYPTGVILIISSLWLLHSKIGRGPLTAVLLYVVTLFPVLGFMNVYGMRFTFVADRWAYSASLALISLIVAAVNLVTDRRMKVVAGVAGGVILAVLATLTWRQSSIYGDAEAFWRATIQGNPGGWIAHNNLGEVLLLKGDYGQALQHFERALELRPDFDDALINIGVVRRKEGQLGEAITQYRKALAIAPRSTIALNNLANALFANGETEEAITYFQRLLEIAPDHTAGRINLGNIYLSQGRVSEAISFYQDGLKLDSESDVLQYNLGIAFVQAGQLDSAVAHFRKAVDIDSEFSAALGNLGAALISLGKLEEAEVHLGKLIALQPGNAGAHANLGLALARQGRYDHARKHYERALAINSSETGALNNFAWMLATCPDSSQRDGNRALELARAAEERSNIKNPVVIRTLAAACAEAGFFEEAAAVAQRAYILALNLGNRELADKLMGDKACYVRRVPIRDQDSASNDQETPR